MRRRFEEIPSTTRFIASASTPASPRCCPWQPWFTWTAWPCEPCGSSGGTLRAARATLSMVVDNWKQLWKKIPFILENNSIVQDWERHSRIKEEEIDSFVDLTTDPRATDLSTTWGKSHQRKKLKMNTKLAAFVVVFLEAFLESLGRISKKAS